MLPRLPLRLTAAVASALARLMRLLPPPAPSRHARASSSARRSSSSRPSTRRAWAPSASRCAPRGRPPGGGRRARLLAAGPGHQPLWQRRALRTPPPRHTHAHPRTPAVPCRAQEGDSLAFVGLASPADSVLIAASSGLAQHFPLDAIRRMGRTAAGVRVRCAALRRAGLRCCGCPRGGASVGAWCSLLPALHRAAAPAAAAAPACQLTHTPAPPPNPPRSR